MKLTQKRYGAHLPQAWAAFLDLYPERSLEYRSYALWLSSGDAEVRAFLMGWFARQHCQDDRNQNLTPSF